MQLLEREQTDKLNRACQNMMTQSAVSQEPYLGKMVRRCQEKVIHLAQKVSSLTCKPGQMTLNHNKTRIMYHI